MATNLTFLDNRSFGTTLLLLCVDRFGYDFLNSDTSPEGKWAPTTMRLEIRDEFGVEITDVNLDKLMSAMCLVTPENFYYSVPTFITLSNGINGNTVDISTAEELSPEEMAWAMTEAKIIDSGQQVYEFSDEIKGYVEFVLKRNGFLLVPTSLDIGITLSKEDQDMDELSSEVQLDKAFLVDDYVEKQRVRLAEQIGNIALQRAESRQVLRAVQQYVLGLEPKEIML